MIAGSFPFTTFSTTEVGTSKMNNSTMETFVQGANNTAAGTFNCFTLSRRKNDDGESYL